MNRNYTNGARRAQKEVFARSAKKRLFKMNEPGTEGSFLAAVYHRNRQLAHANDSLDAKNIHLQELLVKAEGIAAENKLYLNNLLVFLNKHSGNEIVHRLLNRRLDTLIAIQRTGALIDFNICLPLIKDKAMGRLQIQILDDGCTVKEFVIKSHYRNMNLGSMLLEVAEEYSKTLFGSTFRIGGDYRDGAIEGTDIFFEKAGYSVWIQEHGLKFSKTIHV